MDVLILANDRVDSAAGERARWIAGALDDVDVRVEYRALGRLRDAARFARQVRRCRGVVYTVDLAVTPVIASFVRRRDTRLVVDTGDWPSMFFELIRARTAARLARRMERWVERSADAIVVRGRRHAELLAPRARGTVHVVPDGIDPSQLRPLDSHELRAHLGLESAFTVGIQGRFTWYPSLGGGLGWELVEAMARLDDPRVHAVLIGDGPGLDELRKLADAHGLGDRLHMVGRVKQPDLAQYLSLCDVCILTLTNDPSSQVRTTGKLPCYLATGRYVIASRVGTPADVLPDEMLIDYHGSWDRTYPDRLAERLRVVMDDPERARKGLALREAAAPFHYDTIARAAAEVVQSLLRAS